MKVQDYQTYRGCFHIHSTYSDGGGTVEQIMGEINRCSLDFAVVTDHNTLRSLEEGKEGWYGNALLLIGVELSLRAGHFLALDVPADLKWTRGDVQGAIDNINAAGGFGIVAHPSSRWAWKDWSVTGYSGIEVVNMSSLFHLRKKSGRALLVMDIIGALCGYYKCGMRRTMSALSDGSVERWSGMISERQVIGIGGMDAHSLIRLGKARLHMPPYSEIFQALQLHILVPEALNRDLAHDKAQVYGAIREGRCYTVYAIWGDPSGFCLSAGRPGEEVIMGQSISMTDEPMSLKVTIPGNAPVRCQIYHNQELVHTSGDHEIEHPVSARGAYWVEVYLQKGRREVPWVISNPVYVV